MTGRLAGRAALVSGGASGIGLATARRLRAEGAEVVLADRHADAVRAAAAELSVAAAVCDVSEPADAVRAVAECAEHLGRAPDVLVNAAGIYRVRSLLELAAHEWDAVQAVNLRGTFLLARGFALALIAEGRSGAVVNLSSTAGLRASAGEPAGHYAASKAGVLAVTRQMAVEWAPAGIRANAVCPGVIDTPMLRLADDPEAAADYLERSVPLRRLGRPEDVAAAVCFLASDDAAYVTGTALAVDGGSTAL